MDLVRRIRDRLKKLAVRIADAVGLAKHVEQTPPERVEQTVDAVCPTPEKGMAQETGHTCGMTDVQRGWVPEVHEHVDDYDEATELDVAVRRCRRNAFPRLAECGGPRIHAGDVGPQECWRGFTALGPLTRLGACWLGSRGPPSPRHPRGLIDRRGRKTRSMAFHGALPNARTADCWLQKA